MATVTNTVKLPDGSTPNRVDVTIELVASTTSRFAAGWVDATDVTVLSTARPTVTAGAWSASLTPNDDIDPTGTVYRVTEVADRRQYVHYISVPSAGGTVHDLLVAAPTAMPVVGRVPSGGNQLQALVKGSGSSYDTVWRDLPCCEPGPLVGVTITAEGSNPRPIDYWDDTVWAVTTDGRIHKSVDDGVTFTAVVDAGAGGITAIRPCADGEIIVQRSGGLSRSTGWATSPTTATFATVLTPNLAAYFLPWGLDGDPASGKWIATEYAATGDWDDSRYVYISLDDGATWDIVYDSTAEYPANASDSHMHGCCYDPWDDRFWFVEGHAAPKGTYYSDDDGATWTKVAGSDLDGGPTVLVATDDGIVCGTDSDPGGVYGIARRDNPTDMTMTRLWTWWPGLEGIVGFAQRGFRDPRDGLVYMGWNSSFSTVKPIIAAGTASSAGLVWESPTAENGGRIWNQVVTATGKLLGWYTTGGVESRITAQTTRGGAHTADVNNGNILGGTAAKQSSMAIGYRASAADTSSVVIGVDASASLTQATVIGKSASGINSTVVIGHSAAATTGSGGSVVIGQAASSAAQIAVAIGQAVTVDSSGTSSVAIGQGATITGAEGVAIGRSAAAAVVGTAVGRGATAAGNATALGYLASASGGRAIAIGQSASATLTYNIAIGDTSSATNSQSLALGRNANAGANNGVAIGVSATVPAGWNDSVALGSSTTVTAGKQIQIGDRHIGMTELSADPAAGATNSARLYARDNGSGKTQLCVRFATGAVQVIATEP